MASISFKDIFNRYGMLIRKYLKTNIENSGTGWRLFDPPTTTDRTGTHKRMWKTGRTKNNAFKHTATDTTLTIFVDSSYEGIIDGNNIGSFGGARKNQVYLFPMDSTVSDFEKLPIINDLKKDVETQLTAFFETTLKTDIERTIRI
jgi:hypothetical protein